MMRKTTTKGLKATLISMSVAGILLATPGPMAGQEQIGCLRGKPMPECRSFWIIEMQGVVPVAQTSRTIRSGTVDHPFVHRARPFATNLEWNLGHMVNVGAGYAVGGVLTVGSGGYDVLTGMRLRGRKWLNRDLSVELEAGLLRSDAGDGYYPGVNGWTSDVRLNIRDQGSFFLRYDGVGIPATSYDYDNYSDPGGIHHGLSVGASAGSVPALIGTGALGIAYVILFALFWEYD